MSYEQDKKSVDFVIDWLQKPQYETNSLPHCLQQLATAWINIQARMRLIEPYLNAKQKPQYEKELQTIIDGDRIIIFGYLMMAIEDFGITLIETEND